GSKLRVLPFVHHAVHAALPAVILAEVAPMVLPHRATVIMPFPPAVALRAFQVAHAPMMMMRTQQRREPVKPRLLRIIKARIKRLAGLGDALEAALALPILSARCANRSNGALGALSGFCSAASRAAIRSARNCAMSRNAFSKSGQFLA